MRGRVLGLLGLVLGCGEDGMKAVPPPPANAGTIVVRWSIEDVAGNALTCAALGAVDTVVTVGGAPVQVACGDPQEARFERLLPARYAVFVQIRGTGGAVLSEKVTNVVIDASETEELNQVFTFDLEALEKGTLRLRWTIEGEVAAIGCAFYGATRVLFKAQPESISPLEIEAPCEAGELVVERLNRGTYVMRATLANDEGPLGDLVRQRNATVQRDRVVDLPFDFSDATFGRATLHATWTVTGTAASVGCNAVNGEYLEISLLNQAEFAPAIFTATAACARGQLTVPGLRGGAGFRTRFRLYDFFERQIDLLLVRDVTLLADRTTTVAVDLDLQ